MPHQAARLAIILVLFGFSFSSCSLTQNEQAVLTPAQPTIGAKVVAPTARVLPPATTLPTPRPTRAPTTIPTPTAAPTATPDPWAQYAPYTIEGLRSRSYGTEGQIE